MPVDPVCGIQLKVSQAIDSARYEGEVYYFCCVGCKETFKENPEEFLDQSKRKRDAPQQYGIAPS